MNELGNLVLLGTALIFIGFFIIFLSSILHTKNEKIEVKTGGIIFIGPIPLIFGNDKGTIILISFLAIVMMIVFWLIFKSL